MRAKTWQFVGGFLFIVVCEALNKGDVGVCLVSDSEERYRNKTVMELRPCHNGKSKCQRKVTRLEPYQVEVSKEICCDGYEYVLEAGKDFCKPLCFDGCEGGRCTDPDVCTCDKPLILDNYKCVSPTCDSPCIHGECTAPNTCTCNNGYSLNEDNFTCAAQCISCDHGECVAPDICECHKGYEMKDGKCMPVCKNACTNGFCSGPDVCSCNKGYALSGDMCQPVCEKPCVNGICVSPNTCGCLKGYKAKDDHKEICEPKCDSCDNGDCIAPNECQCHRGYALIDQVCTPICREMCVNGNCSAPNVCTCKDGYTQNVTEPSSCYRPCSVCIYGTCNLDGECICENEFELINGTCFLLTPVVASGIASTPGLAGLELSWLVGGAVGVLLVVLVMVAINHIWRSRKDLEQAEEVGSNETRLGSVIYTAAGTLIRESEAYRPYSRPGEDQNESDEDEPSDKLMTGTNQIV